LHIFVKKPRSSTTASAFFASICKLIWQNCIFQTLVTHPKPHWWSRKTVEETLEYTPEPIFCSMEAAIMQVGGLDEADAPEGDSD